MNKTTDLWTIVRLEAEHSKISFPEYQREPTVWARGAKQRLIDSIARDFDIASLYIYDNGDGSYDCVDGRQRIGAIMSFLGKNLQDTDNGFEFKVLNEIYTDEAHRFGALNGLTYAQIKEQSAKGVAAANTFLEALAEYELTIVKLTGAERPEEFNLQFTRLNLGTIINSGEKLNAMVGDMRDVCFDETGLGQHRFLAGVKIPTRRYSKEQTTAQILAHVFSIKQTGDYTRTRHFDLQRFFKEHVTLADVERGWIDGLRATFDRLADAFEDLTIIRNRAITVSTALLAWKLELGAEEADEYAEFIEQFVCRLNWQVAKGLEMDNEYRYLMDFQRHVTQASVEKPAVKARAEFLETQYQSWLENQQINGDAQYIDNSHRDPSNDCQSNA